METKYTHITGKETDDELYYQLFDGNQPYREESVAELHARGRTDTEIIQGILSAKKKSTLPEHIASDEVERGRAVVSDFFGKLNI